MSRKKKDKSNVDQVLGEVMEPSVTESPAVHQVEKEDLSRSFDGDCTDSEEPTEAEQFSTDEYAEDDVKTIEEPKVFLADKAVVVLDNKVIEPSNLTITFKPVTKAAAIGLIWKGQPAGEFEALLKEKAIHFSYLHFGQTIKVVDQAVLDRCAGDYRFLREIDKLTRTF